MKANSYSKQQQDLVSKAQQARLQIRSGELKSETSGIAPGLMQANIVILPKDWAYEFLTFCTNNPVACPLLSVSEVGNPNLPQLGQDLDIRYDVPEYQVFRNGQRAEVCAQIDQLWNADLVTFALGCSFSFEQALLNAGLDIRNIRAGKNVSMYNTNIATASSGRFHGDLVVSMRPFNACDAIKAIQITSGLPKAHGAPVHLGDSQEIGITNLAQPDYGDAVTINDNELPLFWACGVTSQRAIENAKPPIAITHSPGKMLITDIVNG